MLGSVLLKKANTNFLLPQSVVSSQTHGLFDFKGLKLALRIVSKDGL